VAPSLDAAPTKLKPDTALLICDAPRSQRTELERMIGSARESAPALKVLLVADDTWNAEPPDDGGQGGVLRKPFSLAGLAKAVRAALSD
jgi:hypothetical protein